MSNILTVYKGPPNKVDKLKPTGKVVQFKFRKPKAKPLKLRYTMRNSFEDIF